MLESLERRWPLFGKTINEWLEDNVPSLGAALAYYTALSIAPLLVIALAIAALFLGEEAAHGGVMQQMKSLIGEQGAKAIEDMIASANKPSSGILATVLSVVVLLFGASGVFGQLQHSLNTIWEVEPKPGRGLWGMIRDRFLSLAMVLGIAFLLLVSLVLDAALSALTKLLGPVSQSLPWLAEAIHLGVSFIVIALLFAMLFKFLPDAKIAWRDVWLGSLLTAALFIVGKFAIGLYLGHSGMASSYGVAGSFVVLLVWVYYSAQILFFGAEFTQVYSNLYGSRIVPAENAQFVTEEARAQQGRPKKAS
jgi:membrane protein